MRFLAFALVGAVIAAGCGKSGSDGSRGAAGEGNGGAGAAGAPGARGGESGEAAVAGSGGSAAGDSGMGATTGDGGASSPSAGAAGASAITCEWDYFIAGSRNEEGVGDACFGDSLAEVPACTTQFCISRPLADRWPRSAERMMKGHCTKHCETDADCGTGARCCEPQREPFCLPFHRSQLIQTGCSEPCATNYLGCSETEVCCERIGKLCVSDKCTGICPN